MSAAEDLTPEPLPSEWFGVDPWKDQEAPTTDYPDPIPHPASKAVCRCPAEDCTWTGARAGWPSHHRLTHAVE